MNRPAALDSQFTEVDHPFPSGLPIDDKALITEDIKRETHLESRRLGVAPDARQISVRRTGYTHHGVALGDGTVVHFTGEPLRKMDARVQRTSVESFLNGGQLEERVLPVQLRLHPSLTVLLALLHVGMTGYHLVKKNCEHFATFCETGGWHSHQIHTLTKTPDRGSDLMLSAAEAALDSTLGRFARWLEAKTPSGQERAHIYSRDPTSVDLEPYFYGYLFDGPTDHVVLAPVRQICAEDPTNGGFWGTGLPWERFSDWTPDAPPVSKVTWVGDLYFDTNLRPYLRTSEDSWYRGDLQLGADSIPPLPDTHSALVDRAYPLEWF